MVVRRSRRWWSGDCCGGPSWRAGGHRPLLTKARPRGIVRLDEVGRLVHARRDLVEELVLQALH